MMKLLLRLARGNCIAAGKFSCVCVVEIGWWFVNVDDFHEGWVPATYLEPLYGSEDVAVQRLDPGEGRPYVHTVTGISPDVK